MSEFPKTATKYITDRMARMSRPAQLRVPKIAAVVEAWHNDDSDHDYPTAETLSAALGFKVNPREFKFAERLARYNIVFAAHQSGLALEAARTGFRWN